MSIKSTSGVRHGKLALREGWIARDSKELVSERSRYCLGPILLFPIRTLLSLEKSQLASEHQVEVDRCDFRHPMFALRIWKVQRNTNRKQLADANTQWEHGSKDAAISIYKQLTEYGPSSVPESERSIVYGRLIESDLEHAWIRLLENMLRRPFPMASNLHSIRQKQNHLFVRSGMSRSGFNRHRPFKMQTQLKSNNRYRRESVER